MKVEVFSSDVVNPVAISVDEKGRVFVAETGRFRTSALDIRDYPEWLADDLACRTTADREKLIRDRLGDRAKMLAVESERIRLLKADTSAVFAEGFSSILDGTAGGILARNGQVWFASAPNLWLINGEGRKALSAGHGVRFSFAGHGLHGPAPGPDGKLYFSVGDSGTPLLPDEGGILRCNADGSALEVFARGLRNPRDLVFDDQGNLWTADSAAGLGDESRWIWVVEGADYGWRVGYQSGKNPWTLEEIWKGAAPYTVPPVGYVGKQPAGLAFRSGRFYVCDLAGSVRTFSLKPKGAGYEVADEQELMRGLIPTDADFGPDGALYVTDMVDGPEMSGKGRVLRVTVAPSTAKAPAPPAAMLELQALGKSGPVGRILDILRGNDDPFVRHAGVVALSALADAQTLVAAGKHESKSVRLAALLAMRRLASPDIKMFLDDADADLVFEAARAIYDVPIPEAIPSLAALAAEVRCPPRAALRALYANVRLGTPFGINTLLGYALRASAPETLRIEALRALGSWVRPPGRDRVTGLWRPMAPRDQMPVREAMARRLKDLIERGTYEVRVEATHAAAALDLPQAGEFLHQIADDPQSTPQDRARVLESLARMTSTRMVTFTSSSLEDFAENVRLTALRVLPGAGVPDAAPRVDTLLATERSPAVRRAAIAALGEIRGPAADTIMSNILDLLMAGRVEPALQLDVIEAAAKRPAVKDKLARHLSLRKGPLAEYQETLEGGDVKSGEAVFFEKGAAACARCHRVNGRGGTRGPDLSKIGAGRTRPQLLEAIVFPNERKRALSPLVEDAARHLPRWDVRDLVEYLASLK